MVHRFNLSSGVLFFNLLWSSVSFLHAGNRISLTLENAVEIAMSHSYQIRRLELGIERSTSWLQARKAGLKSHVSVDLRSPDLKQISDTRWNSALYRDEIVRLNSQLWQSQLSIRQPVILFGYPTNGFISLNYNLYRYAQQEASGYDIDYYNRLFIKFEQPFFLPNKLKNDLEVAEANLKDVRLNYLSERMVIMNDIASDYYDAFEYAYLNIIFNRQIGILDSVHEVVFRVAEVTNNRRRDPIQLRLEIAHMRENLLENQGRLRMKLANLKQKLNLDIRDSLYINPVLTVQPASIDLDQAIHYGFTLNPWLRRLAIWKRKSEIDLENIRGHDAFHMRLEMTYGLEKSNHSFSNIWMGYDNSNSVTLKAYLPVWDWGRRRYQIDAERRGLEQRMIDIEEREDIIRKSVINAYTNLMEYSARFYNMQESLELAEEVTVIGLDDYRRGETSFQELLQMITRRKETETKLLEAYLGYKRACLELTVQTYYDFEKGMTIQEALDF
ncbi:MAG TPA: TolC family protein [bacterium]|nr:TolC family protein [bacterium]